MTQPQSAFRRAPRPLIGWGGPLLIIVCLLFLLILASIATLALWRWANGQPVDMNGFAAVLTSATAAGAAIWSLVKNYILTRSDERREEIRSGGSAPPPFASPPEGGPRPGDSL
jgi:hypothetical protein